MALIGVSQKISSGMTTGSSMPRCRSESQWQALIISEYFESPLRCELYFQTASPHLYSHSTKLIKTLNSCSKKEHSQCK